ncbi:group I truncated hemoglobin [Pacificimonas flava]|uniref:Cyanoglobin n=1 Tax=Pacificimonas flava TaxID=1234595 RepID=M2U951_9SPHN|nr:group 1 truncated hemoglobin [Pacificimonas flava]EMD84518.1 Cyanoglobin [Pacificimonas flava]MBB5279610.1 hemoglobin [Pacificimonas flava]
MLIVVILIAAVAAGSPARPADMREQEAVPVFAVPGEEEVAPYTPGNRNAGADPFRSTDMWEAFGGEAGVSRIVDAFVARNTSDARIAEIFRGYGLVRLRRTLKEQFCYILGGPCDYSGRDMKTAHEHMGLQHADMNALVENLQAAMTEEGVPFSAQNKFLSKLAPMRKDVIER